MQAARLIDLLSELDPEARIYLRCAGVILALEDVIDEPEHDAIALVAEGEIDDE